MKCRSPFLDSEPSSFSDPEPLIKWGAGPSTPEQAYIYVTNISNPVPWDKHVTIVHGEGEYQDYLRNNQDIRKSLGTSWSMSGRSHGRVLSQAHVTPPVQWVHDLSWLYPNFLVYVHAVSGRTLLCGVVMVDIMLVIMVGSRFSPLMVLNVYVS